MELGDDAIERTRFGVLVTQAMLARGQSMQCTDKKVLDLGLNKKQRSFNSGHTLCKRIAADALDRFRETQLKSGHGECR